MALQPDYSATNAALENLKSLLTAIAMSETLDYCKVHDLFSCPFCEFSSTAPVSAGYTRSDGLRMIMSNDRPCHNCGPVGPSDIRRMAVERIAYYCCDKCLGQAI